MNTNENDPKTQTDSCSIEEFQKSLGSLQDSCKSVEFGQPVVNHTVLISGCGKTTCALSLREKAAFFCRGQFDPLPSAKPWHAVLEALDSLLVSAMLQPPVQLDRIRAGIMRDLSTEFAILSLLLPHFSELMRGYEDPTRRSFVSTDSKDSMTKRNEFGFTRIKLIARSLLHCIPSSITIFLDNVEFADYSSAALLKAMMEESGNFPVLLVLASGSGDKTEWATFFPNKPHVQFSRMIIPSLSSDDLGGFLEEQGHGKPLAQNIFDFSNGNPHLLRLLSQEVKLGNQLDDEKTVESIMLDRATQLSVQARDMLQIAACWGCFKFSINDVKVFWSETPLTVSLTQGSKNTQSLLQSSSVRSIDTDAVSRSVTDLFDDAVRFDFLHRIKGTDDQFEFPHVICHQICYNFLSPKECQLLHLRMGKYMLRKVRFTGENDSILLLAVDQLNLGSAQISRDDCKHVAELNLRAARSIIPVSAFDSARALLEAGLSLVSGETGWRDDFKLVWELHSWLCRMYFCLGRHSESKKIAQEIISKSTRIEDRVGAYDTLMSCFRVEGDPDTVLKIGNEILEALGEPMPRKSGKVSVVGELFRAKRCLRGLSAEALCNLPSAKDHKRLAAMKFRGILSTTYFASGNVAGYAIANLRNVRASVIHGVSKESPKAFASLALLLVKLGANYHRVNLYREVALKLGDRVGEVGKAQALMMTSFALTHFQHPVSVALDQCLLGYELGMESGDVVASCTCLLSYCLMHLWGGFPLTQLEERFPPFVAISREYNQHVHNIGIRSFQHFCEFFTTQGSKKFDFEADDKWIRNLEEAGAQIHIPIVYAFRTIHSVYFRDMGAMERSVTNTRAQIDIPIVSALQTKVCFLFLGLAEYMLFKHTGKKPYWRKGNNILKTLNGLLARGDNKCEHMVVLLEAEKLRASNGPFQKIVSSYKNAVKTALDKGFVNHAALANELLGRYLLESGKGEDTAAYFLQEAAILYGKWNAQALVQDIFDRYQFLRET